MKKWREIKDKIKSEYIEDVIADVLAGRLVISAQGNDQYFINGDQRLPGKKILRLAAERQFSDVKIDWFGAGGNGGTISILNKLGYDMNKDNILSIEDDVSSLKIYEIINKYFGESYTGWMKATYNINDEYIAWFPTIREANNRPNGTYGGTQNYSNTLSEDGKTIIMVNHDEPNNSDDKDEDLKRILVFGRVRGIFKFLGVFEKERVLEVEHSTYRFYRVATGINLTTFELIDESNTGEENMTEWFISGNPKLFNLIDAFHELGKVDWKQSANIKVGDTVYIYVSANYQRIMFKCKVNRVDLPNLEIDDSAYYVAEGDIGEFGRYMELEPIDEFDTDLFSLNELKRFGFTSPQGPRRVVDAVKKYIDVVQYLLHAKEMDPDKHDGSYELARETIRAYINMGDLSKTTYRDLNLLYHMVIGTWKLSVEQKKKSIDHSNLPQNEKDRLKNLLDNIWERAINGDYENREEATGSIGMFGTGFYSFDSKDEGLAARAFLGLCAEIFDLADDEEIYRITEQYFSKEISGLKTPSASAMLHCLKPNTFPILNTNFGSNTIYEYFGVELEKPRLLTTYVSNCRKIRKFRDEYFKVKNYRIYDNVARMFGEDKHMDDQEWWPSKEEYDPGITTEQWVNLLCDPNITSKKNLAMLAMILDYGKPATCSQYAEVYGKTKNYFNAGSSSYAEQIAKETGCPTPSKKISDNAKWWPILYVGRDATKDEKGSYVWKLRDELKSALDQIDLPEIVEKRKINREQKYGLNIILYGPPGTGKTYSTVKYAVEICDPSFAAVHDDYKELLGRFNELKSEGRIVFTTFHQSYGYEEFIEGIKPELSEGDEEAINNGGVGYEIESGVFKRFCERASLPAVKDAKFVFIIDEINRGNISKIMGELITLIEDKKRIGNAEAMKSELPYSGTMFGVPNNVYIIGTMNTADRSIALMDTALRRRFNFIEMMPDRKVIDGLIIEDDGERLDVAQMLITINERIEYLYDREHTIGHAFFTGLLEEPSIKGLSEVFRRNVIPLLQEYFFEDYEKVQLVLGDNEKSNPKYKFILDEKVDERALFKGMPDLDVREKKYTIQTSAFDRIQSYIEITERRKAEE